MIDNLCASVGLARAPPPDALARFVDLAQTLNSETIGDILLDKLEDPAWQVSLLLPIFVFVPKNSFCNCDIGSPEGPSCCASLAGVSKCRSVFCVV